ncbi:MAG: AAA family ATPase [Campylobacterales bacterium]|nr:AAA family ATPase [Campylobacterales bacterium]
MGEHFIKNIEIRNFKCFENFTAEGFGRVNLIGGKNNVGKTAFMEAVYVNVYAQDIKRFIFSLHTIKYMRENLNILENNSNYNTKKFVEQSNNILVTSNKNHTYFKINEHEGVKKYHFEFNQQSIEVNANEFSFELNLIANIVFIDNFGFDNTQIKNGYLSVQKKDQEQFLNNILNKFDNRIEKFIAGDVPQCRLNGEWLDLTELGDGARHLVSIVTSLFQCENSYLFIDELDNGIHYTQLDELWEIILKVSKEQNVQVFATTHSKECIESYARVAKKLEDEEVTYIRMSRLKDGSLHAGVRDYNMLQYVIDDEHEVR